MSSDTPVPLDHHRGMAAQKATELRRLRAEVEADEQMLRQRHNELQARLVASPAENWFAASEKARYLINLLAGTPQARDPRWKSLIAALFDDFDRLSADPGEGTDRAPPPEAS
ncbi:MAG: hypothetical protein F9K38_15315 [Pseudorhodoplanes sp.]|nr:MAG: hypothetical protein F9K38_15315 [Pseudorhodoplanes sp.]